MLLLLPQFIAWRIVFGHWLIAPFPVTAHWNRPSLIQVLFSQDRGFFYWTPLAAIALAGYVPLSGMERAEASTDSSAFTAPKLWLLLLAFLVHLYVVASVWGGAVQLGAAFGFRQLTECGVLLAPALALLLGRATGRWFSWLVAGCCLAAVWNLLLICQYRYAYIPCEAGASFGELVSNTVRLLYRKRLLIVGQAVAVPVLLWVLVGLRVRGSQARRGTPSPTPGLL